jgi:preprotein translocase subunit YajC
VFTSISAATTPAASGGGFDPMTLILLAVFAVFIFMMFRRNKAAKKTQQEQQAKLAPGVEIMTNFGLFGTVLSIDDAENKVVVELSPGTTATVHRQTITKIMEPSVAEPVIPNDASSLTATEGTGATAAGTNSFTGTNSFAGETPEETLDRLNNQNRNGKDN